LFAETIMFMREIDAVIAARAATYLVFLRCSSEICLSFFQHG